MKVDLHSHTRFSRDSVLEPRVLVARARAAGLDRIAVTDHNVIDGALEAHAIDPALVIIGEEIHCAGGTHLIGLFLREAIPPGLRVPEVADRIRRQGGVVYAPHPYAYLVSPTARALDGISVADVVEVFNARAFWPAWNRLAARAARDHGLPAGAGSDSHFAYEIGSAWTEVPAFHTAEAFRRSLAQARPVGLRTQTPFVHCLSLGVQLGKTLTGAGRGRRPVYIQPRARYRTDP